ncbi:MAG TPA: outer-membrane lipoprotein carrier protein LolA [Pyrinomonadaceae bacterium]|nr:outer-membrane lipoprotein carrier protein LolA [Pyrinomonadaceae bacterium]
MSKYLRVVLPAIAILFLFNALSTEASAQSGVLGEILKRMDDNNRGLTSLKSNIKMAKHDSVLGETDLTEGDLNYLPGKSEKDIYVRIDWAKPVVEHLAIANGQYVLYRPRTKQAIVGKVDSAKGNSKSGGALAFMTMSRAQLRENYEVKYGGEETVNSGVKTFHLVLIPRKPNSYKSADLWVDANGMPIQAKIIEKNNDSTTVLLSNIQRNATVKASVFKISPPKGTAIVQG